MHVNAQVPPPGSQTRVNAGLWRERPEYSRPAPHSGLHRWTLSYFPTCCPSFCWSVSPSDGSGQSRAETQEMLKLGKKGRSKANI